MPVRLSEVVNLCASKVLPCADGSPAEIHATDPVLILLAAGKGTRFGEQPKCVQPVHGKPLARHTLDAFGQLSPAPCVCLVGYQSELVCAGLGRGNHLVRTDDPAGGTALAAMEAFCFEPLERVNPIVVVAMGDRVVPEGILRQLLEIHRAGSEATLTMLTADYDPPGHVGKGRVVRGRGGTITRIVEQRDIDGMPPGERRSELQDQTEGNCPLYAIRAATLKHYLGNVTRDNAQGQFYFTDIVEAIARDGGTIRSLGVAAGDPEYAVLCADVTRPEDLASLERALTEYRSQMLHRLVETITADRAEGQSLSIAAQLEELTAVSRLAELGFDPNRPIGIGISGGRLRIAFMHPDMGRFFGPAWQMPIGAAEESGRQQIVVIVQAADDQWIRLYPTRRSFREQVNAIPAGMPCMYPPPDVVDGYSYESFGTAMTQQLLQSLGYLSNAELAARRDAGAALPDASRWVGNAMRRPFALLGNVIASLRTVRDGQLGRRVQAVLGCAQFGGLKVASTGEIPQGGFSSSSAFTVAAINALDALFQFQCAADQKVQLACQAEYGTGVRAGALDQATEQNGRHSVGALISSNPRENYRTLGTYDVPADRFRVCFPYTVDRDSAAWQWSAGMYTASIDQPRLTAAEMRKMTGKAAELAAILMGLPVEVDLFQEIEHDLVETGQLGGSAMRHVRDRLAQVPVRITQAELRSRLEDRLDWFVDQQRKVQSDYSRDQAQRTFASLLGGWRDPLLRRTEADGQVVEERGAPLRAMLGYLYAEVAHNCYLIHHPEQWIGCVTRSQRGDRSFQIDAAELPTRQEMLRPLDWEHGTSGTQLMEQWLREFGATPFDFNRGIGDTDLARESWCLTSVRGTNFFRGLALIDLAEAMLKRAFGDAAVAVRVNGAGQGDYFQVHVDSQLANFDEVKQFIRQAIYVRFGLRPRPEFVEPSPGGGAVGLRLARHGDLLQLVEQLRCQARQRSWQQPGRRRVQRIDPSGKPA
jgi:CTP:molybdopterin cytidylyltransferase MocA